MLTIKKANREDTEKEVKFLEKVPHLETGFLNWFDFYMGVLSYESIIDIVINMSAPDKNPPITTYFLWKDNEIIGMYHVLHKLNEIQKNNDGHISYTILKEHRGHGYATEGLKLVLEDCISYVEEDTIYMSCDKTNQASLKVQLNNGAHIARENETKYYTELKIK